ncbi:hypothetical protein Tco_0164058 [Tanacetum coccineum]
MAALVSCPKHNMVACLEKTEQNAQFHKIVDFLTRSSIYYSLTTVSIFEASIRRDLLFIDVDGIDCLTNQETYENLQLMGHDTTQVPRDSLEGTGGSKGDQVQSSNDRPHSGGNTSERAEGGLNLQERIKKLETKYAFNDLDAGLAHGMDYMETEEAVKEGRQSNETEELNLDADIVEDKGSGEKGGVAQLVLLGQRQEIGTVDPTTTTIFDDEEMTLANTLVKMKDNKAKGVVFKDTEELVRPTRSVLTLKPLLSIDSKDKGKGVLEESEPVKKMTRSDFDAAQVARDAEVVRQLEAEWQAEVERERQREEQASMDYIANLYDEVQAGIDVDALFAAKLQQEEREEYIIEERAKFLAETIAAQRKFRAAQRAAEIRIKDSKKEAGEDTSKEEEVLKEPDRTRVEVKLEAAEQDTKNTPGKTVKLKARKKGKKQAHADTNAEHDSKEDERKIESMNKEDAEESTEKGTDASKKRKGGPRMKRQSKRKKIESDLEEEGDLKTFLKIVPDKEGIIDYENQERWNLKSWNFYENYGVHTLTLEDDSFKSRLMKLEAMMEERRIFKCWFHHHTTNGHQFTMSNRHQELASLEQTTFELASPKQTALGKDFSNPLIVDSLLKTIWLSMHHVVTMKHWLFQSKRLLVKKKHQLRFLAGRLPKLQGQLVGVAELLRCCDVKD